VEILHDLADAIAALSKAYDKVEHDETVSVHIRAAQESAFRAVSEYANGQILTTTTEHIEDWTPEDVKFEDWMIDTVEAPPILPN